MIGKVNEATLGCSLKRSSGGFGFGAKPGRRGSAGRSEGAVAAGAGGEAGDALGGFGQGDEAVLEFASESLGLRQTLLVQDGEAVLAEAGLGEGGDLGGELFGGLAGPAEIGKSNV